MYLKGPGGKGEHFPRHVDPETKISAASEWHRAVVSKQHTIDEVYAVLSGILESFSKCNFDEDAPPTADGLKDARKWHEATQEAFINRESISPSGIKN